MIVLRNKNYYLMFILLLFLTSCRFGDQKKVKDTIVGIVYECIDLNLKDGGIFKRICFNEEGDSLFTKTFFDSDLQDYNYVIYHPNKIIKEKGRIENSKPIGKWNEYYINGHNKSIKFFKLRKDTSRMIYVKNYKENGNLESSILPILTEINKETICVDSTYELKINLLYSEFDTLKSIVFLDKHENIEFERDSLLSMTKEVIVKFTPRIKGELIISGLYAEFGKGIIDELNIADRNFRKTIVVK